MAIVFTPLVAGDGKASAATMANPIVIRKPRGLVFGCAIKKAFCAVAVCCKISFHVASLSSALCLIVYPTRFDSLQAPKTRKLNLPAYIIRRGTKGEQESACNALANRAIDSLQILNRVRLGWAALSWSQKTPEDGTCESVTFRQQNLK